MRLALVVCDCCGKEFDPDFSGDLIGDEYVCEDCLEELQQSRIAA